ncbi:MAG: TetR/AcrR family transcriptional regulator [Lachnospiraceae bacterium]|nr:TetR/AcrR family transcriptional regulator [Candidatus Merdinaster equi]
MNEKFWNLNKEKQDRMMNAAMMVFSENGYTNACTDVIVKEAQISKGLLFHYFVSKQGLYEFIINYGIRYIKLECSSLTLSVDDPFWRNVKAISMAKNMIMKQYPYVFLFLNKALHEKKEQIGEDLYAQLEEYKEFMQRLYICGDLESADSMKKRSYKLAMYADQGAMELDVTEGKKDGSLYYIEMTDVCDMMA